MKVAVNLDGVEYEIPAQWLEGKLWYHWQGVSRVWEPQGSRRNVVAGQKRKQIMAPMPGKVTKVLKSIGEQVQEGDVVIILEAMKMEYSLKAEVTGPLKKLEAKVGDQVILGKVLAEIGESK